MSYVKQVQHEPDPDLRQPMELLALCLSEGRGLEAGHQAVDEAVGGLISKVLERKDFKGKKNSTLILHSGTALERILLVGLGKQAQFSIDVARQAAGTAASQARKNNLSSVGLLAFETDLPEKEMTQAAAEGLIVGS